MINLLFFSGNYIAPRDPAFKYYFLGIDVDLCCFFVDLGSVFISFGAWEQALNSMTFQGHPGVILDPE